MSEPPQSPPLKACLMSTPGDPFETEALDETRARQRRLLRETADWVVTSALRDYQPMAVDAAATALVEIEVRGLIDEELADDSPLTQFMNKHTRWNSARQVATVISRRVPLDMYFDQLAQILRDRETEAHTIAANQIPSDALPFVVRLIRLLVMADELSSDGYRDSRLSSAQEPGDVD